MTASVVEKPVFFVQAMPAPLQLCTAVPAVPPNVSTKAALSPRRQ
ncbi:hypothetical protein [Pengzhenrongella phosphoraccumulans]